MDKDYINYFHHLHLQMGITRSELQRRLSSGQIDLQTIRSQLDQYSREMKLEVRSEIWLQQKSLDQVDKFKTNE